MAKSTFRNLLDDFWTSKAGDALVNFQNTIQSSDKRINLPEFSQQRINETPVWANKAGLIAGNVASGTMEAIINEPIKIASDMTRTFRGDEFSPASKSMQLGENLPTYFGENRVKPFATVGMYGKGEWGTPELGLSESPIAKTLGLSFGALEPIAAAKGSMHPKALLSYLGMAGGINVGINEVQKAFGVDTGMDMEEAFFTGANQVAPKVSTMVGVTSVTNPFIESISGDWYTRLPLKSFANVLEGLAIDQTADMETTPTSLLIDALFPVGQEVGGKVFKSAEEGFRSVQGRILEALGKPLRNKKGAYTTLEKFVKGTRPYFKNNKDYWAGAMFGFNIEQDDDGNYHVVFDPNRAAIGMALMFGGTKVLRTADESLSTDDIWTRRMSEMKERMTVDDIKQIKKSNADMSRQKRLDIAAEKSRVKLKKAKEEYIKGNKDKADMLYAKGKDIKRGVDYAKTGTFEPKPVKKAKTDIQMEKELSNVKLLHKPDNIAKVLPSRSEINTPGEAELHFERGLKLFDELSQDISKSVESKGIKADDFIDMVDGKRAPDTKVLEEVNAHRKMMDKLRVLAENPKIGVIQEYFPHMKTGFIDDIMVKITGDTFISKLNLDGGNLFNRRTGELTDYARNYNEVMKNYTQQVMWTKYGDLMGGVSDVEKAVLDHVKNSDGGDYIDYIDLLNKGGDKPVIRGTLKAIDPFNRNPLRTDNSIFQKVIGGKIFDKFSAYRDAKFYSQKMYEDTGELQADELIEYFVKRLNIDGSKADRFRVNSTEAINKGGLNKYKYKMIETYSFNKPLRELMDEITNHEFKDPVLKGYVNKFIDDELKGTQYRNAILDSINDYLSSAHIGGNIKVAFMQGSELNRAVAVYGLPDTLKGMKKALVNKTDIVNKYGFGDNDITGYQQYEKQFKQSLPADVYKKAKSVLFAPLNKMENFKNRVYAGAAEERGIKLGLEGDALTKYVRDEVFEYAHIADKFNTPVFMKNDALRRSIFQYSQYAVKNTFGKVDAITEKNLSLLAGYLAADVITMGTVMAVTGIPFSWAIQQLSPGGLGPLVTLPFDLFKTITSMNETKEKGYSTKRYEQKLLNMAVQNLVMGGAQISKTVRTGKILMDGYSQTPTGGIKYIAPESGGQKALGLVLGPNALAENRKYYKGLEQGGYGGRPMGKNQSEMIKQSGDKRSLFNQFIEDRKANKKESEIKAEVKDSGEARLSENMYYYYDNGSVKTIDLNKTVSPPDLVGDEEIDKELLKDYKADITKRKSDIVELYERGVIDKDQTVQLLDELSRAYEWAKAITPKKASSKKGTLKKPKNIIPTIKTSSGDIKVSTSKLPKISTNKSVKGPSLKPLKMSVLQGLSSLKNSNIDLGRDIASAYKVEPLKKPYISGRKI